MFDGSSRLVSEDKVMGPGLVNCRYKYLGVKYFFALISAFSSCLDYGENY
jgi:hypothetical protein